jgi:hypothetical protein
MMFLKNAVTLSIEDGRGAFSADQLRMLRTTRRDLDTERRSARIQREGKSNWDSVLWVFREVKTVNEARDREE